MKTADTTHLTLYNIIERISTTFSKSKITVTIHFTSEKIFLKRMSILTDNPLAC